jgi:hypothetical protein
MFTAHLFTYEVTSGESEYRLHAMHARYMLHCCRQSYPILQSKQKDQASKFFKTGQVYLLSLTFEDCNLSQILAHFYSIALAYSPPERIASEELFYVVCTLVPELCLVSQDSEVFHEP